MLNFTKEFNTPIPPELEGFFERWVALKDLERKQQGRGSILLDKGDYDIQGFFLAELQGVKGIFDPKTGHGTDLFKKPNHPTFSNESIYHVISGYEGGVWDKDKFNPSADNIKLGHGFFKTILNRR